MEECLEDKVMKKPILIIVYKFPPMGGVGSRRWAKFAKHLSRLDYAVHVLTINKVEKETPNWQYDIDNSEIIVHRIPSGYPNFLLRSHQGKYRKIFQKIVNYILKRTFFYIDIAQNWKKYMLPEAARIINNFDIETVIVTSPPHSVAYYATYLKIDFPDLKLIQDFRDNWNDDSPYCYPDTLKLFRQKERSVYMEFVVVCYSDYLVNVTQDITNRVKNKFQLYKDKFITIHNGFDKDDLLGLDFKKTEVTNKIKVIYAGSLGLGRIKAIEMIMDFLLECDSRRLDSFEFNFFTPYDEKKLDKKYCNLLNKIVFFHRPISPKKILLEMCKHEYCLSINSPIYPYAFGTKIFDYMLLNKKIIHISDGGELHSLMKTLGQISINYNKNQLSTVFNNLNTSNNQNIINYSEFNIEELLKQYEALIND
jgi:glycosyltransferase involved in cell wall biosynthesis